MRSLFITLFLAVSLSAQSRTGELRLRIADPAGLAVKASVEIVNDGNQFRQVFQADDEGRVVAKQVPFGVYAIHVEQQGFAPFTGSVEVRSAVPTELTVHLSVNPVNTAVVVTGSDPLIDPHSTRSVDRIGQQTLEDRLTSIPGRSLVDVVNSQPGWLYEGNAVLHPRGSEYQTQFVVDGIPLTDNRSPSFGPEIEADDLDSMSVYTAGFPAEYGREIDR